MKTINKDYVGGVLVMLFGQVSGIEGARYGLGELANMGPGFYPVVIGGLMTIFGAIIVAQGLGRKNMATEDELRPEWRGWTCICSSIVAFIVLVTYGGLLPATFAVVFISAMGDKTMTVRAAATTSIIMCVVAVVVFRELLEIQIPMVRWGT